MKYLIPLCLVLSACGNGVSQDALQPLEIEPIEDALVSPSPSPIASPTACIDLSACKVQYKKHVTVYTCDVD